MGKGDQKVQYKQAKETVVIDDVDVEEPKEKESCCSQMKRMPGATWPILTTELCERFSYYGIKAVLVLYLTKDLAFSKYRGKSIYHAFSMVSYFTGVMGAIMADSLLGKFRTVAYSLVVYSIAEVVLTLTSVPTIGQRNPVGPLLGLFITAVACGNIKPCLAAFGGDQYDSKETGLIAKFFSMFYMAVNVGATFSMIFMPMLRTDVQCFGGDCYPATFGVPCALIVVATIAFIAGSPLYKKKPPEGNMMVQVARIISHAIKQGFSNRSKGVKYPHWLDHAQDNYKSKDIDDVKALLKVLKMYIPLPVFWALFHQQGSSWTLQAEQMNGDLGSLGTLRSDQIQFFNPVLVLILIPLFDSVIYPIFERCRCGLSPLKKMVGGMFLAAVAFVVCALVQIKIQTVQAPPPQPSAVVGQASVDFINVSPCASIVLQPNSFFKVSLSYGKRSGHTFGQAGTRLFEVTGYNCSKNEVTPITNDATVKLQAGKYQTVLVELNPSNQLQLRVLPQAFGDVDIKTANSRVRYLYVPSGAMSSRISLQLKHVVDKEPAIQYTNFSAFNGTYDSIRADEYKVSVSDANSQKEYPVKMPSGKLKLGTFGAQTVLLIPPLQDKNALKLNVIFHEDVGSTTVHRIWQLPQYVVITAGEVMFSVTGLEFAYSQAPSSMKSVLQAFWVLTVAFGDLLVVIFSEIKPFDNVEKEMFLYGGLMLIITIIFAIMAFFYHYSDYSGVQDSAPADDKIELEKEFDREKDMNGSTTQL